MRRNGQLGAARARLATVQSEGALPATLPLRRGLVALPAGLVGMDLLRGPLLEASYGKVGLSQPRGWSRKPSLPRVGAEPEARAPEGIAAWPEPRLARLLREGALAQIAAAAQPEPAQASPRSYWRAQKEAVLSRLSALSENDSMAARLQAKADQLAYLEERAPPRGLEALAEALTYELETLEQAFRYLDTNRNGEMSLLEFTGGMSLLNVDVPALCGMEEKQVFRKLDRNHDGAIQLKELLYMGAELRGPGNRKLQMERQKQAQAQGKGLPFPGGPLHWNSESKVDAQNANWQRRTSVERGSMPVSRGSRRSTAASTGLGTFGLGEWADRAPQAGQGSASLSPDFSGPSGAGPRPGRRAAVSAEDLDRPDDAAVDEAQTKWTAVVKWFWNRSMVGAALEQQRHDQGWRVLPQDGQGGSPGGEGGGGSESQAAGFLMGRGPPGALADGRMGFGGEPGRSSSGIAIGRLDAPWANIAGEGAVPGLAGSSSSGMLLSSAQSLLGAGPGLRGASDLPGLGDHRGFGQEGALDPGRRAGRSPGGLEPGASGRGEPGAGGGFLGLAANGAVDPRSPGGSSSGAYSRRDGAESCRGDQRLTPHGESPREEDDDYTWTDMTGGWEGPGPPHMPGAAPEEGWSSSPSRRRRPRIAEAPVELPVQQVALDKAEQARQFEKTVKAAFNSVASLRLPDGTVLMNRPDLLRFFADLPLADPKWSKTADPAVLNKLYDEAIALQVDFTRNGRGLTFWSFKVVLNNVMKVLGNGWFHLMQKRVGTMNAPEAQVEAFQTHASADSGVMRRGSMEEKLERLQMLRVSPLSLLDLRASPSRPQRGNSFTMPPAFAIPGALESPEAALVARGLKPESRTRARYLEGTEARKGLEVVVDPARRNSRGGGTPGGMSSQAVASPH